MTARFWQTCLSEPVDATRFGRQAFASCPDGKLEVADESAPGKYDIVQTVTTPLGARTMDIDPATLKCIAAVSGSPGSRAWACIRQ